MEPRAGLPQVVGAGRCPTSLGKNQVLLFLLLMVLLVWNWLEALESRNFWGDLPSPSCRAPAWAGEWRLCLCQQGQGLGAQGWCFPAGSTSSFPMEKLEEGFMKDVASSQQEQDIHHQVAGCRQGCAGTAVVEGLPCPGWAEMPTGNPALQELLKSPHWALVLACGNVRTCCTASALGAMSAACSQPTNS